MSDQQGVPARLGLWPKPVKPDPPRCDPNTLTGCCRWDHDHDEETP